MAQKMMFTPPGWALAMFGEIRGQVDAERPTQTLPRYVYLDDQGRADPWMDTAVTTVFAAVAEQPTEQITVQPARVTSRELHTAVVGKRRYSWWRRVLRRE